MNKPSTHTRTREIPAQQNIKIRSDNFIAREYTQLQWISTFDEKNIYWNYIERYLIEDILLVYTYLHASFKATARSNVIILKFVKINKLIPFQNKYLIYSIPFLSNFSWRIRCTSGLNLYRFCPIFRGRINKLHEISNF